MTDEDDGFAWGMAGPTDPVERVHANNLDWGSDDLRLVRGVEWDQTEIRRLEQERQEFLEETRSSLLRGFRR